MTTWNSFWEALPTTKRSLTGGYTSSLTKNSKIGTHSGYSIGSQRVHDNYRAQIDELARTTHLPGLVLVGHFE